jgi:hypothetical protein
MTQQLPLGRPGTRLMVADDGASYIEGVVVKGEQDDTGRWDLDSRFVLQTDEGERFTVDGWCCSIERCGQ